MKPKYLNPIPIDTEQDTSLSSINETVKKALDNDWTQYCQYELDDRRGYVKYPHVGVYKRCGDTLTSEPYISYRLHDSSIQNLRLSYKDNLTFVNCTVKNISGGNTSRVTLRNCKVESISNNTDSTFFLEDCDISQLVVSNNTNCQFSFKKNVVGYSNTSRGIPDDPYSELYGSQSGGSGGSGNTSSKCGFISNNTKCRFSLEEVTLSTGKPIRNNTNCDIWLTKCTCTVEATFANNTNCHYRLEECTVTGNNWVVDQDTNCELVSKKCNYTNSHGYRGSGLTFFMSNDKMQQNKCFAVSNSHISLHECTVGGDTICEMEKTQLLANSSQFTAGTNISKSKECHFSMLDCQLNSGDVAFDDQKCKYDINKGQLQSGSDNFKMEDCSVKIRSADVQSSTKNFNGKGSVCLVSSKVNASTINFEGQFTMILMESSQVIAPDGLKGKAERFIARRTKINSGSHSMNGFSTDHAEMEEATFTGKSIYNGSSRTYQRDTQWSGPCIWNNISEMHEVNSKYTDQVTFNKVNTWGVGNQYTSTVSVTDSTHFNQENAQFASSVSISNSTIALDHSQFASTLSLSSCQTKISNSTINTLSASNCMLQTLAGSISNCSLSGCSAIMTGTSAGSLNASGSAIQLAGGSASVNADGGSVVSCFGASANVAMPHKSLSCGGGQTLLMSGSKTTISAPRIDLNPQ